MPARMTRQQLAQLKDEDTFPPRGGRSSDDTFPPRGLDARLAGASSNPEETFPPRLTRRASARGIPEIPEHRPVNALDAVFDRRDSNASELEAAIKF